MSCPEMPVSFLDKHGRYERCAEPTLFPDLLSTVLVCGDDAPQLCVGMVWLDGKIPGPRRKRSYRSGEPVGVARGGFDARYFEAQRVSVRLTHRHHANLWSLLPGLLRPMEPNQG